MNTYTENAAETALRRPVNGYEGIRSIGNILTGLKRLIHKLKEKTL
jgi:hypothetical protein